MSRITMILSTVVFAAAVTASTTASAITVNWGTPTAINSNLDIINPTGVIHAVNFATTTPPAPINVNVGGEIISFDATGIVGGAGFANSAFFVDDNPAPGSVGADFESVLDSFRDNSTSSYTFTGLTAGETYFVQAFQSDDRGNRPVDWNVDGTSIMFTSDTSLFRSAYAIAEVILDGGETSFKLERPGGPPHQINAAVLSQPAAQGVPEPSTFLLAALGLLGLGLMRRSRRNR